MEVNLIKKTKNKLIDNFGYSRVIETKGMAPVTAWKLDNSRKVAPNECRIALDIIHIEGDSFQQLCSECGFDDTLIKAKVLDILQKRGKLQNPFTKTGGLCCGTIEEMGASYSAFSNFKEGDYIICQTTLTALPMHIDEIYDIDYNYGQLKVKGYVIAFQQTIFGKFPENLKKSYTIATIDEAGSLYNIYSLVKGQKNILIIARDLISAQLFAGTVRLALNDDCHVTVVMDENAAGNFTEKDIKRALGSSCDDVHIVNVSMAMDVAQQVYDEEEELFDFTINCEDKRGSEVLSVLATLEGGKIYFTTAKNRYVSAVNVAESMCKTLDIYSFDQYDENKNEFVMDLLYTLKSKLEQVDTVYREVGKGSMRTVESNTYHDNGKTGDFIFASKASEALVDEVINIASYDCNVIIQGETGVGKEMVLNLIHNNSERKSMPCVKINCATIQENLAEAEFFGYEDGSFTGAKAGGKKGYFEAANGGILFLDEIGQLEPSLQSKLLRVIQENQFYRVGGTTPISVDVRVICANNIPLRELVEKGKFREDLYYRLNICIINIPPLRERIDDIPVLSKFFLEKYCNRYGVEKEMAPSAFQALAKYEWPGNVRELENVIHRTIIGTRDYVITGKNIDAVISENEYEDILVKVKNASKISENMDFNEIIQEQEKILVEYALKTGKTTRKAAELLNMTQAQLMRKKQKYNL